MVFQVYRQLIRRSCLTPSNEAQVSVPTMCSAVVLAATSSQDDTAAKPPVPVKPSQLPLYDPVIETSAKTSKVETETPIAVEYIGYVRQEVQKLGGAMTELTGQLYSSFLDVQSQVNGGIDYLRKEEHFPEQIGFIAAGGLTGFLFAIRRGFFKKLLYLTFGAAGSAAVVYPDEASFYFETGIEHSQRSGRILYHFINGVARDYAGFELPALPDNPLSPKVSGSKAAVEDSEVFRGATFQATIKDFLDSSHKAINLDMLLPFSF